MEKEFNDLYTNHYHIVFNFIRAYLRKTFYRLLTTENVQDLTQQTFLCAWLYRHTFKGQSLYSTWLLAIAKNKTKNFMIKEGLQPLQVELDYNEYLSTLSLDYDCTVNAAQEIQTIERANKLIDLLPDAMRLTVNLLLQGYSYAEIAEKLDINIGTVRSRLFRAKVLMLDS